MTPPDDDFADDAFDLDAMTAALRDAPPRPDPARRAADLALARKNFAATQGTRDAARRTCVRPRRGALAGVRDMLNAITTRGGLTVTTALVAVGVLVLTPQGQDLLRLPGSGTTTAPTPVVEQALTETPVAGPTEPMPAPPQVVDSRTRTESTALANAAAADMAPADDEDMDGFAAAIPDPSIATMEPARAPSAGMAPLGRVAGSADMAQGALVDPQASLPDTDTEAFGNADANPLKITAENPVSTFSIDVDTASYAIVRQSLNAGHLPPTDAVRIEEMVNYFPYAYPAPGADDGAFRPTVTVMDTPWNPDTDLVHIAIQGQMPAIADRPPLNLVFLVDTSGSMEDPAKLPLLKQSFRLMLDQLRTEDQVAIVEYAGSSGLVLEPTAASDRKAILDALTRLGAGGSTNGQGGLEQAYAVAAGMAGDGQIGRILLATDGDFNVGLSGTQELTDFIAAKRDTGVYLSVLGFGRGNLDDATMQALAQNGNGIAAYIDTLNEAQKVLVDQLTGALFPIAGDVKVQVEFNPATVAEYRLIGYETRALRREQFNDDRADAGDLGAGHSVTALFEITPVGSPAQLSDPLRYGTDVAAGGPADELGFLRLRWKAPGEDTSSLIETPIEAGNASPGTEASFAAAVAGFGQLLRNESHLGDWGWDQAIDLANANRGDDPFGYRTEAVRLMRLAESLSAE